MLDELFEGVLKKWVTTYRLTAAERAVLAGAACGMSVADLARSRGSAERTVAKHVENVLFKTGDRSLSRATNRLLLEVVSSAA